MYRMIKFLYVDFLWGSKIVAIQIFWLRENDCFWTYSTVCFLVNINTFFTNGKISFSWSIGPYIVTSMSTAYLRFIRQEKLFWKYLYIFHFYTEILIMPRIFQMRSNTFTFHNHFLPHSSGTLWSSPEKLPWFYWSVYVYFQNPLRL